MSQQTCDRTECGGRPEWHPVLLYRFGQEHEPCPALPAILGMFLCEACMTAATLEDFDSDALRRVVENLAKGMGWAKLDFARTSVSRERIGRVDWKSKEGA